MNSGVSSIIFPSGSCYTYDMLSYLSASGHNNYTKLKETEPAVYMKFLEGQFVLRHGDSYWSGIFSDLCIEQVLVGSIKSVFEEDLKS